MFLRLILTVIFQICLLTTCFGEYIIKGKVNVAGEWQHHIYLATIDKLDNYYSAKAEYIVNSAEIDTDGNFSIAGDNLPQASQFYKLYLIKEEHSEFNACLFEGGDQHNFIHLILHNESKVEITSDMTTSAPFGDYAIKGDQPNQLMKSLSTLVYPSYQFYEIRFPSELQYAQNKLNNDLFNFADTCSVPLVSLAAINNTDYDTYFDTKIDQYRSFGKLLRTELRDHPYTKDYIRKMKYYGEDEGKASLKWWQLSTLLFGLLSLFLGWKLLMPTEKKTTIETPTVIDYQFTKQEQKILSLIVEGKSNKEIASELYIELSTVKSHINKLYAKMSVSSRKEAIKIAESQ